MSDPATTAAFDQLGAVQRDVAGVAGEYFRALIEEGFERQEAHDLVRDWLDDFRRKGAEE